MSPDQHRPRDQSDTTRSKEGGHSLQRSSSSSIELGRKDEPDLPSSMIRLSTHQIQIRIDDQLKRGDFPAQSRQTDEYSTWDKRNCNLLVRRRVLSNSDMYDRRPSYPPLQVVLVYTNERIHSKEQLLDILICYQRHGVVECHAY